MTYSITKVIHIFKNNYSIRNNRRLGYLKCTETLSVFDIHVFLLKVTSGTQKDRNLEFSST